MGPKTVLTARMILTQHRAKPVKDGFVLIGGGRILEVGERKDLRFLPAVRHLDLGDTLLLPGLINAHTHLDFTCLKDRVPFRGTFRAWLADMGEATRHLTVRDVRASILEGVRQSLAFGTTTLLDVSSSYESYALLKRQPLRATVFFELLDFTAPDPAAAWHAALERMKRATALPPHPSTLRWGISPHTAFTVSRELLHLSGRYVQAHPELPTAMHLGESREEREFFARKRGPIARRTASLQPSWPPPDAATPLQYLAKRGWLPKLDLAVHCNTADEKDLRLLARHRIAVAHCPGSHAFFGHPPFRYGELRRRGVRVCLGTDSLASNESLSMFREMRLFRSAHPGVSAAETLSLATREAARAAGWGGTLGQVRPGFLADLIGIPVPSNIARDTEACSLWALQHEGEVSFRMLRGETSLRLLSPGETPEEEG